MTIPYHQHCISLKSLVLCNHLHVPSKSDFRMHANHGPLSMSCQTGSEDGQVCGQACGQVCLSPTRSLIKPLLCWEDC